MHSCRLIFTFAMFLTSSLLSTAPAEEWIVRLKTDDGHLFGKPLYWDDSKFFLLGQDGFLLEYDISKAQQSNRINRPFENFSQAEMRAKLQRELGRRFDVTGTGHYLVAHPAGQRDQWPERFERLYREMGHYFAVRGITIQSPDFPLIAIVFPHRDEFFEYARRTGDSIPSSTLGYYDHKSNRIMLYDVTGAQPNVDWRLNAETVVHEAAHQTAFNVGIHSRFTLPPRWIAEGLGTMFEAKGVYDAAHHRNLTDRINYELLGLFLKIFGEKIPPGTIASLVTDDRVFLNADAAYSLSWALTFMMAERQPRKLSEYLQLTASKKQFKEVSKAERLRDFQKAFGSDMAKIEFRLTRYMKELQ